MSTIELHADFVVLVEIDGVSVPTMSRRALIVNKRAAGRAKDLADVEWLEANASVLEPPRD